jgi:hypothetical protein
MSIVWISNHWHLSLVYLRFMNIKPLASQPRLSQFVLYQTTGIYASLISIVLISNHDTMAWPWDYGMTLRPVYDVDTSAWHLHKCITLRPVHDPETCACPWDQWMTLRPVHDPGISVWPWIVLLVYTTQFESSIHRSRDPITLPESVPVD